MLLYLAAGAAFVLLVRRGDGPYVLCGSPRRRLAERRLHRHPRHEPARDGQSRKVACACRTRRSCAWRS
jgi:hypothetical protein